MFIYDKAIICIITNADEIIKALSAYHDRLNEWKGKLISHASCEGQVALFKHNGEVVSFYAMQKRPDDMYGWRQRKDGKYVPSQDEAGRRIKKAYAEIGQMPLFAFEWLTNNDIYDRGFDCDDDQRECYRNTRMSSNESRTEFVIYHPQAFDHDGSCAMKLAKLGEIITREQYLSTYSTTHIYFIV